MPLISQPFPLHAGHRPGEDSTRASIASSLDATYERYSNMKDSDETEMENKSAMNEMDASENTPAIPQRSELRASRLLESLIQLNSMEKSQLSSADLKDTTEVSDPHEVYLSSEEDASEAADDYDESIIELDMDSDASRPSTSNSYEITARAVSFVYVGKPHLIDIFAIDTSATSPSLSDDEHHSLKRPSTSRTTSNYSNRSFRPTTSRTSSLGAKQSYLDRNESLPTLQTFKSNGSRPSFLDTDPFPASEASEMEYPASPMHTSNTQPPRTPTSLASTALKNSFMRMSNIGKKKVISGPKAGLQFLNAPARSSTNSLPQHLPISAPMLSERGRVSSMTNISSKFSRSSQDQMPVMQEEDSSAIEVTDLPSPKLAKMRSSMLAIGRRKSMKAGLAA